MQNQPWRLGMWPIWGGISAERLLTLRYKSVSWVNRAISFGIFPLRALKCKYKPVKLLSSAKAAGNVPERPFPCREILATRPCSLQPTPSKEPLHGSAAGVHEAKNWFFGSREALMAIRVGSSASEDIDGEGKKRRRREMRRVREGSMFVLRENGQEKWVFGKVWDFLCGKVKRSPS